MRYLLVLAACFCLTGAAVAQTGSNVGCLDLGDLAGKPTSVLWAHSFSAFMEAHQGELTQEQIELVRQAIDFGSSRRFALNKTVPRHTIKGLLASARQILTRDQFSELLAGMGPNVQQELVDADVIAPGDIACSCKTGVGPCPEGYPCTVGCTTWGTGEWNGICKRATAVGTVVSETP